MHIPFGRPEATAKILGGKAAPSLFGSVKFYEMGRNVLVVADFRKQKRIFLRCTSTQVETVAARGSLKPVIILTRLESPTHLMQATFRHCFLAKAERFWQG